MRRRIHRIHRRISRRVRRVIHRTRHTARRRVRGISRRVRRTFRRVIHRARHVRRHVRRHVSHIKHYGRRTIRRISRRARRIRHTFHRVIHHYRKFKRRVVHRTRHTFVRKVGGILHWFKRKTHGAVSRARGVGRKIKGGISWAVYKIKRGAGRIKNKIVGSVKKAGHTTVAIGGGLLGGILGFFGGKKQPQQQPPLEQIPPNVPVSQLQPEQMGVMDKIALSLGAKTVGELQTKKNMLKYGLIGACLIGGIVLMSNKKAKS